MPWPSLASSCPAFGTSLDLETSLDFVSAAQKREKNGEGCETATSAAKPLSIRDAWKPHPETIPPLKSSFRREPGERHAVKKKREGLAQVSRGWNRFA